MSKSEVLRLGTLIGRSRGLDVSCVQRCFCTSLAVPALPALHVALSSDSVHLSSQSLGHVACECELSTQSHLASQASQQRCKTMLLSRGGVELLLELVELSCLSGSHLDLALEGHLRSSSTSDALTRLSNLGVKIRVGLLQRDCSRFKPPIQGSKGSHIRRPSLGALPVLRRLRLPRRSELRAPTLKLLENSSLPAQAHRTTPRGDARATREENNFSSKAA